MEGMFLQRSLYNTTRIPPYSMSIKSFRTPSNDFPSPIIICCGICGEEFYGRSEYQIHAYACNGSNGTLNKCNCNVNCDSTLKPPNGLSFAKSTQINFNIHTPGILESPFQCKDCGESFKHKIYLHYHKAVHLNQNATENKQTLVYSKIEGDRLTNTKIDLNHSIKPNDQEVCIVPEQENGYTPFKLKYRGRSFTLVRDNVLSVVRSSLKVEVNTADSEQNSDTDNKTTGCHLCEICGGLSFTSACSCGNCPKIDNMRQSNEQRDKNRILENKRNNTGANSFKTIHEKEKQPLMNCTNVVNGFSTYHDSKTSRANPSIYQNNEIISRKSTQRFPYPETKDAIEQDKLDRTSIEIRVSSTYLQLYLCEFCGNEFRRKIDLDRHIRIHTGERPFSCSTCGRSFIQKAHLNIHTKRHYHALHASFTESSPESTPKTMTYPSQYHDIDRRHVCQICKKAFSQRGHLNVHMLIHTGDKPFQCDICSKTFNQKQTLKRHMVTHIGKDKYISQKMECASDGATDSGQQLFVQERINAQENRSLNILRTSGEDCNRNQYNQLSPSESRRNDEENMEETVLKKPRKEHICEFCGKEFGQKGHLNVHILIHTGAKPFKCNICYKEFNQKQILKRHLVTHRSNHTDEPQKPDHWQFLSKQSFEELMCESCGKIFTNKYNFQKHRLIHSGQKPFLCGECGKSFRQKNHLVDHQRIHTGNRPFACNICSKTFSQKQNLKKHYQRHEKNEDRRSAGHEYNSQSDGSQSPDATNNSTNAVSGPKIVIKSQLVRSRERIHTCSLLEAVVKKSLQTFHCGHCGKDFKRKEYLKVHLRTHTGEKPYQCSECFARFSQRGHLWVHMSKHR